MRVIFNLFVILAVLGAMAQGQAPDNLRVKVANLEQDMYYLKSQLGSLRLEVERLTAENGQLRESLAMKADRDAVEYATLGDVRASVAEVQVLMRNERKLSEAALAENVNEKLSDLGKQVQDALNAMAKSLEGQPRVEVTTSFSDDYPREGVVYTVERGDTLTKIAKKHGSSVEDIKNANRISNPRSLKVGQTLFIPQRQ